MRAAVISDTHLPRFGRALPAALVSAIEQERVDRILHCGDWTRPFAVDLVGAVAPLEAVAGNNDPPELVERLGLVRVIELDGARIGLTHGHVGRASLSTPERALTAFPDVPGLAAICFGHSHIPLLRSVPGGPLLVNPGSPTDKRRQPRYSWALLEVTGGEVRAELRFFDR